MTNPTPTASLDQRGQFVAGDQANTYITITVADLGPLPKRWTAPAPPTLSDSVVPRALEMTEVADLLKTRAQVAIGGQVPTVGMQGMAGIGKTTLAKLLVHQLAEYYPDGILWTDIGPTITAAADVQPLLNQWADHCVGPLDSRELQRLIFTPDAVRALLAEHPGLLVVLDNVWSLPAVKPLRDALPAGAHLLLTTRSQTIMRELGGGVYPLGLLELEDALAMVQARLHWQPDTADERDWVVALIEGVGRHPLALDVALGLLGREGHFPSEWQATATRLIDDLRLGRNLADLKLDDDDREHNVEAVLAVSYAALDGHTQARFRTLGAFAPDADFSTAAAAELWQTDPEIARRQLVDFANAALISRIDGLTWRQHSLLRGYARGWLRAAGDLAAAATRHAETYAALMRAADDAQHHYELLPAMPQIRHAFFWAIDSDLNLAQNIIANTENLMAAFGLALEGLTWCQQALAVARQRREPEQIARAQGSLGNALSLVATLPDEDRGQRLYEALAAYDEALRFRRPDTAPLAYAMTQNNRANRLSELATLPDEDRGQRLYEALAAYDEALRHYRPDTAPLDYAMTQNNRANRLSELATLPDEDRGQRLYDALAAYDEALRFRRPDTAPLDYAATQNNRATILSALATLPDEDRGQRLYEALAAYDEALRHYRPDTAPLDYAMTQNNRANRLSELATLPDEDRGQRLYEALAAYDEALRFRRPDTAPLDYAATQNNRANRLSELATLPDEDRGQRLYDALAAYDEALRFRRPDTAPLDYAATQNNRANRLSELATLPDEDRGQRLYEALAAYDEALRHYRPDTAPLDYAMTQNNRATILSALATLPDEDRGQRLYDALAAYDEALRFRRPDTAPLDYAMTQGNLANLYADLADLEPEDRTRRQRQSVEAVVTALAFFQQVGHGFYAQQAYRQTLGLRDEFGLQAFAQAWADLDRGDLPPWLLDNPI